MNSTERINTGDKEERMIILFDGVCNLCNGFIDFVIKRDVNHKIFYCSLQSDTAKEILKGKDIIIHNSFSTIYFYDKGQIYKKSTAVLRILKELPNYRLLASFFLIMPAFLRDFFYKIISKNRYRLFGKKESCRLPSPEERAQFL
ncbi:thiol-disulfide oxidoreductase DCC family protein [Aquimarina addita]|uniref:Thiol-disulfide oxidoreductase DCC family protein n=1 Tax=Aquimarina addita TaxID=870485 RepID=A0ABP7XF35_9FLAO